MKDLIQDVISAIDYNIKGFNELYWSSDDEERDNLDKELRKLLKKEGVKNDK